MGTPPSVERHAATYDWAGTLVHQLVHRDHNPLTTRILDVGAGWGKYRDLLPEYRMDACEIWQPYVDENNLTARYDNVYNVDVCELSLTRGGLPRYDLVILGDVLEHIPRPRAVELINDLCTVTADVLVVVPYLYPQGEEEGNPYEEHVQDDLTPELMAHAYQELRLIKLESRAFTPFKGLYRKAGN